MVFSFFYLAVRLDGALVRSSRGVSSEDVGLLVLARRFANSARHANLRICPICSAIEFVNPTGYMRIQGELLKLGVSVSATTIATVLRGSGLGPAPRRIGPSWSEFLRAQAQSMFSGDLHSGMGADLEGDAPEPRRLPEAREAREVGPAATGEWRVLRSASLGWHLSRCYWGAARHDRASAVSLRLEHHRACPRFFNRTLATDTRPAALVPLPTALPRGHDHCRSAPPGPGLARRIASGRFQDLQPARRRRVTTDPPGRAASPNRVSFPTPSLDRRQDPGT